MALVIKSIRKRFGFSLLTNILKAILTFGSGIIVARGMGPEDYGRFIFLLGTFTAIKQLLDMGTSVAFFTFLSRSERSLKFINIYLLWLFIQFLVQLLIIYLIIPDSWFQVIWHGEARYLVIISFLATYTQSSIWSSFALIGESQRLTVWVQGITFCIAVIHFLLIAILAILDSLDIPIILVILILEWLIASFLIYPQFNFKENFDHLDTMRSVFYEFYNYCRPLIFYTWLGFIYEFADRWFIQAFAGSSHQAYFSIASQFSSVGAIVSGSIINIFWKEVAEEYFKKNINRVSDLYTRISRGLFFFSACVMGLFFPWASEILTIFLGESYIDGKITLMIMFFYPLHQSIGQLGGALAYATGQVSTYVKIGLFIMPLSIIFSYILIADDNFLIPGLDLGAIGLALKSVIVQIISVNVITFFLARNLFLKYEWLFQLYITVLCLIAGFVSYFISIYFFNMNEYPLVSFVCCLFIYIFIILLMISVIPKITGFSRVELVLAAVQLRKYLTNEKI